jgi:hypothetical protein
MDVTPTLARTLIRSLTRGTAVPGGSRYIHVGNDKWLQAQDELLSEIAEDGHADTKFVRGAYGSGKSHFLSMVQETARDRGWMTSHVECRVDGVQIDRFETLYPKLVGKLNCRELSLLPQDASSRLDPCRFLLDRWFTSQLAAIDMRQNQAVRPLEAEHRLFLRLQTTLLETSLFTDFTRALCAYARARFVRDDEVSGAVVRWLRGAAERPQIPASYLRKPTVSSGQVSEVFAIRPIGPGTAMDVMRGLLWLIRSAGFTGLVLCIDEVEELAKLGTQRRRDQALQALREYVDHAGGEGGFRNFCLYLAATPDMFDGRDYFPRYEALATRIAPVSDETNWRAPVVDLDRTPLSAGQLAQLASRICAVHRIAYPESRAAIGDEDSLRLFVESVLGNRTGIAKPRLLARVIVDALERARQSSDWSPTSNVGALVEAAARTIVAERSQ